MSPAPRTELSAEDCLLMELLQTLKRRGYCFVTPTPNTHRRVVTRAGHDHANDLRDVLGWSLPFREDAIDPEALSLLRGSGMLDECGQMLRSKLRVSSLGNDLYLHSAYPTTAEDAVFFGPDSYRFADLITAELQRREAPVRTIVDIGTGAGVGAIVGARLCPGASVSGTDINPGALRLASINAAAAEVSFEPILASSLEGMEEPLDVVLANPPYIIDAQNRDYRDGGGADGSEVSLTMAGEALPRLADAGMFILYTGSVIVSGRDRLRERLAALALEHSCGLRYREIDPDVFGEELSNPGYRNADRIAVVAAVFERGSPAV